MFDKCGIFGASAGHGRNIARAIYKGGTANNHRGFEGFGIAARCRNQYNTYVFYGEGRIKQGLVHKLTEFEELDPYLGMIHNRYSTSTRDSLIQDNHPIRLDTNNIDLHRAMDVSLDSGAYIIHNGDVSYYLNNEVKELVAEKFELISKTDTAILGQLYLALLHSDTNNDPIASAMKLMKCIPESYSMMIMYDDSLIVMRDPYGKKPLSLGFGDNAMYASSEDRAFKHHGIPVSHHFSVKPFSVYHLRNGLIAESRERNPSAFTRERSRHFCMFEDIYTARFDTILKKNTAYYVREKRGRILGRELRSILEKQNIVPDVAAQVPISAEPYAVGLATTLRIPYDEILTKISGNKPAVAEVVNLEDYDRGYLKKTASARKSFTEKSYMLNPDRAFQDLEGLTVVLVDDTIVRGNTMYKPVRLLRDAKVNNIIVAVGAPPIINTCYGGNDFVQNQLAGWNAEESRFRTVDEINEKFVGADLLYYISRKGMIQASDHKENELCVNCWSKEIWKPKADLQPLIEVLQEF